MEAADIADPLINRVLTLRLPKMQFSHIRLEIVVETLRQQANRALVGVDIGATRELSVVLLAVRSKRTMGVTLQIENGTPVGAAFEAVATQAGLIMVAGALGLLLCAEQMGTYIEHVMAEDRASRPAPVLPPCLLNFETQLLLLSRCPAIGVSDSPLKVAWLTGCAETDWSGAAVLAVADRVALDGPAVQVKVFPTVAVCSE